MTPTAGQHPVQSSKGRYYFLTRVGAIYPLVHRGKKSDTVMIAARASNGGAVIQLAKVLHPFVHPWPIKATTRTIAHMANQFLGAPYGWGDLCGYRDCSTTTKDLFAPFAIGLPRHSTAQVSAGIQTSLANKINQEKIKLIQEKGTPFFTLLTMKGHVVLYVGNEKKYRLYSIVRGAFIPRVCCFTKREELLLGELC